MAYAHSGPDWVEIDGPFVIGEGENALSFPANWAALASEDERVAHGVAEIIETERPEAFGARVIRRFISDVAGMPTRAWETEAVPFDELQAQLMAAAQVVYDDYRQRPLAWDFGTIAALDDDDNALGDAGAQTLQMRTTGGQNDLVNWLAAQAGAAAAIGAGAPNLVQPIKTTANVWVQTTALQVMQVLVVGDGVQASALQNGALCLKAFGAVKAAIAAAVDAGDLITIDLEAGYPG